MHGRQITSFVWRNMNIEIITTWVQDSIWGMFTASAIGSFLGIILKKIFIWFFRWVFQQAKRIYKETTSSIIKGLVKLTVRHILKCYRSWRMVHEMDKRNDKFALSVYANDLILEIHFTYNSFLFLVLFTSSCYVFFRATHPWFCVILTIITLIYFYSALWVSVQFSLLDRYFLKKYRIHAGRFFKSKEQRVKNFKKVISVVSKKNTN